MSIAAAAAAALAPVVHTAAAGTLDWDITPGTVGVGNGAVDGGTGTWDTSLGNWTADGGSNNVAWLNANNDVARFAGTAGTVTLTTGITAGGLTFNSDGYLVTGNTLTLAGGTPTITVTNAADTATIASILAGTAGFTKAGAGKVIINGANTFTGDITLNGGTLETNMAGGTAAGPLGNQIGTATYRQVFFNNNATLRTTATWNDNTPSATNTGIVFNFTGAGTLDVASGTLLTIDDGAGAGTASTNAQLQGSGTLTKTGAGTLSLGNGSSDFSSFTGAIVVAAGTLQLGSGTNQFGTTSTGTTVQSGAALNVQANTTAEPLTISGTGVSNGGALYSSTGTAGTASGPITLAANSSVGGAGNLTLSGVVSGGFNLTKVAAGALSLNGANTYTGTTTIAGGSIRAAFGTGLPSTTNLIINGGDYEPTANFTGTTGTTGGTVQIPGGVSGFSAGLAAGVSITLDNNAPLVWGTATFNPSVFQLNQTTALGIVTLTNPIDLNGAPRTFNSNGTAALPGVVSGAITSTGGATGVVMTGNAGGANIVQFTNANNTGINSVTLTGGELGISVDGNIGGATTPINFNGGGLQILGTTLTGFGAHPVTFTANKNVQLDINAAANTFAFDAATPLLTAGQTLTKVGAGTLKLAPAATNTVTTLNMNGGTLDLNGGTLNISNLGSTTIRGTANSTINNGTIVLSTAGGTNFADNSVNNVTLTINAKVSGADNTTGFEYCCDTSGTIVLTNPANDFQGNVYLNSAGTISVPAIGMAGAAGPLGKGSTIFLTGLTGTAPNQTGSRLLYTGTGETTDRVISLGNIHTMLDASGGTAATPLKFTSNVAVTNTAAKTFVLQGTGFGEIAGVIPNNTGATSVTKAGTGTWTLSGTNTYTGTTTLAGGTLSVSAAANLGAAAAPVTFNGGFLRVTGTTLNNLTGRTVTYTSGVAAGYDIADAGNTFSLGGAVSLGTGDFTKAGAGTLVMTGANSVRTLNANGGTIDLGSGTLLLNNAGGNTIRGTANATINNGTITISMAGTTGVNFGDNSVNAGVTLTINSKLTFAAGATTGFEYCCDNPGGTIVLTNPANDFPGVIQLNQAGTVAVSSIKNAGQVSAAGSGGQIVLNGVSGTQGARFMYVGAGDTTDRTVVLNQTQNVLDASGTTTAASRLKFTSNVSVTNAAAKTFTLQGTGYGELAGVVPDNTATTSVIKAGTGTWALSGANTYTGVTTVAGGVLNVASLTDYGVAGSLGARAAAQESGSNVGILLQGGTLQYTGSTPQSTNRQIRLNNNATNAIDASGSVPTATLSFTKTGANTDLYENAGARTLTLTGTNTGLNTFALTLTDQAAGTGVTSLMKTGAGTWVLTGSSTYTGPTTVSDGRLLANNASGSATGAGTVTVNGTGVLGGSGSVGAVVVAAGVAGAGGPAISPGNSPGILGVGNLTLNPGSDAVFELLDTTPGTGYDRLSVTGTVNLGTADLVVASVGAVNVGDSFTIISNDAADAVTGTFFGLPTSGSTFFAGGTNFAINYAGGDGNDVVLTVVPVPEPATAGLAVAVAAGGLLARRRRRRA